MNSSSVSFAVRLLGAELPLVAEQRRLVDVRRDVVEGDALHDLRAGERRHEDRVVVLDRRRAVGAGRPSLARRRRPPKRPRSCDRRVGGHAAPVGIVGGRVALDLAEAVHHAQALERVLAVEQPALVDLAEVALDVGAGERGAAEQHRDALESSRLFSSSRLSRMMSVDFTSSPLMPMASALTSSAFSIIVGDRHLDADVVHLVAVVREDDVDEVLADVVDVALHGGEHDAALAADVARPSPCAARGRRPTPSSSRPTAARTAAASRPAPNSSPTTFMPASSMSLTMLSAGDALGEGLVEVVLEAVAVAVDDALAEALLDRPVRCGPPARPPAPSRRRRSRAASAAGRSSSSPSDSAPAVAAAVVDEVEADVALLVGDAVAAA